MEFYAYLIALNIACFLPLYFLNIQEQANPFRFLIANRRSFKRLIKIPYLKFPFTDPFRVNFDYTFIVLIAAALQLNSNSVSLFAAVVWTFGIVEIAYASVMQFIFKRPPSLQSDISLAKSGLSIVHHNRWLYLAGITVTLFTLLISSYLATSYLLQRSPGDWYVSVTLAICLAVPALYHCRLIRYPHFLFRTMYSPIMGFYKNTKHGAKFRSIRTLDRSHFEALNAFQNVVLEAKPSFITICIESYGSFAFKSDEMHDAIHSVVHEYSQKLADSGLHVASNFSESPIFAGGSWLSYVSFTYGIRVHELQLYDALFYGNHAFPAYESLFHVLKRNGYHSTLLCPLGGFEPALVHWDSINKCFLSDRNYDWDSLKFAGQIYPFLEKGSAFSPPDQYSLNFAYDDIVRSGNRPFSLFFCTLNSHYPWVSPTLSVDNWRILNKQDVISPATTDQKSDLLTKYKLAIRYQLDYILRFATEHASENLVITLFGDHQAPFITPGSFGKETPVHVISSSKTVTDELCKHGFVSGLDLSAHYPVGIRHEGFLSLFMGAVNRAFGQDSQLQIGVKEFGADIFGTSDDERSDNS